MRTANRFTNVVPAVVVALLLAVGLCASATAGDNAATVDIQTGIVTARDDGVGVVLRSGEIVVPSNAAGLLKSGAISVGDVVTVRIVQTNDSGIHVHRGHVTVLK